MDVSKIGNAAFASSKHKKEVIKEHSNLMFM